jgi:hypothetical protein
MTDEQIDQIDTPKSPKGAASDHVLTTDMLIKGVITGIVASTITQTGRKVLRKVAKSPVVVFGLGFATGYWAHKHRRKIIARSKTIAAEGKEFLNRQKAFLVGSSDEDSSPQ